MTDAGEVVSEMVAEIEKDLTDEFVGPNPRADGRPLVGIQLIGLRADGSQTVMFSEPVKFTPYSGQELNLKVVFE